MQGIQDVFKVIATCQSMFTGLANAFAYASLASQDSAKVSELLRILMDFVARLRPYVQDGEYQELLDTTLQELQAASQTVLNQFSPFH